MMFETDLIAGSLVGRTNRFTAEIDLGGSHVKAHIPTSGRLTELLEPGLKCYIREVKSETRMTPYDLLIISYKGNLVHIYATTANRLMVEVVHKSVFDEFAGYDVRTEYSWGNSRFDLLLTAKRRKPVLVEVKSVTLCEDGVAMFPDAPTSRGVKHLLELERSLDEGFRAYSIFVAQRSDAKIFRPNIATDPEFTSTLKRAFKAGVNVRAYKCEVSLGGIQISDRIPVRLGRKA